MLVLAFAADPGLPGAPGAGQAVAAQSAQPDAGAHDLADIAARYIVAVGRKDFDQVAAVLDPQIVFTTPGGKDIHGAAEYLTALKKLGPILRRNDVLKTFVSGNEVCIVYDFVTDTDAGAVPSVEWLKFRGGKITSVRLIFHSLPWPGVLQELARRNQAAG